MNWRCFANKGLKVRDSLNRKQFKKKRKQPNKTKTKTNKKQPKGIKQIHEKKFNWPINFVMW